MTRLKARITGAVYLLYFLTVIPAAALVGHVPAAVSDAANLIANALYLALTLLLYRIFKPVDRNVALVAVAVSAVGCIVQSLSLFHVTSPQSSLPIFGLFNLSIGYLILRSTFLPRALGVLMVLSGAGWLLVLSPELIKHVTIYIELLGIAAEGALMLWLLSIGVDIDRWTAQAENSIRKIAPT